MNLLRNKRVEITGDSGESYAFTFTRFSSSQYQSYRLFLLVANRYAVEATGYKEEELRKIEEKVGKEQSVTLAESEAYILLTMGRVWAKIRAGVTKAEERSGEEWLEIPLPSAFLSPEAFHAAFDNHWINTLSSAANEANDRLSKPLDQSDEAKKKESENTASSVSNSTNSPKPVTTPKRKRSRTKLPN